MKFKSKQFISRFMAVVLFVCMLMGSGFATVGSYIIQGIIASAADVTIVESGSCGAEGDNITYTLDSEGTLVISGHGNMEDYDWDSSPFSDNSNIIKIIIEDGVSSIGEDAFRWCRGLKSITLPDSVTHIGGYAFNFCTGLKRIIIPDSVTEIYSFAFSDSGLKSIIIPGSVTVVNYGVFSGCENLQSIVISEGVTSIGDEAFAGCSHLAKIDIPDSVISIGENAFYDTAWYNRKLRGIAYIGKVLYGCKSCDDIVEILPGTKGIADSAFSGFSNLTEINIPNSVVHIGDEAFRGCSGLAEINIPNSVVHIGDEAFGECSGLTEINIPDSVVSIEDMAFYGCKNLKDITIPDSVSNIGDKILEECTGLENIYYSGTKEQWDELKVVRFSGSSKSTLHCVDGDYKLRFELSLYGKNNMKSYTFTMYDEDDDGIYVGVAGNLPSDNYSFCVESENSFKYVWNSYSIDYDETKNSNVYNCTELDYGDVLIVKLDTTKVDEQAKFNHKSRVNQNDFDFKGEGYKYWPIIFETVKGAVNYCVSDKDNIVYKVKKDGTLIIDYESNIKDNDYNYYISDSEIEDINKVTIEYGITSFGKRKFSNINNLTGINIPGTVADIPYNMFADCTNLKDINIPDGIKSIGLEAFKKCTSLKEINIPDSVTDIYGRAFYCCESLEYVKMPSGIREIRDGTFSGCTNLTNMIIPYGVTSIGDNDNSNYFHSGVFGNCYNLKYITIPNSVTVIGNGTFRNCENLRNLTIPDGVVSIGDDAFYNCVNLVNVNIPKSVSEIGARAFYNCENLNIYYNGTKEDWSKISIGKENYLKNAAIHYTSTVTDIVKSDEINWEINNWGMLKIFGNGDMPNYTDKKSPYYGRNDIMQIVIEDGVTSIGTYAFQGMSGLMSVNIPDSVTKISPHAFDGNDSMILIRANGAAEIGESAFKNCKNFSFDFSDKLTYIEKEAFYGCDNIKNVVIPSSVVSVGESAFENSGVTNASLNNNIIEIERSVFKNCKSLKEINIPYNVMQIDDDAFNGCTDLSIVNYGDYEGEWSNIKIGNGNEPLVNAAKNCVKPSPELEEELLYKTRLYTSDGGEHYRNILNRLNKICGDENISQQTKMNALKGFYEMFNITSVSEGTEYCIEEIYGKQAYDYLMNDDIFLAYNFKWWLNNTNMGTVSRGLMLTDGWIFNNELKQYINPKTYINQETVDIKNYKAMLLSFMNYKADDGVMGDVTEIIGYSNKIRKYLASLTKYVDDKVLERVTRDFVKAVKESPKMSADEMDETLNQIYKKYNVAIYAEGNEEKKLVHHLEGFPELKKAFKIAGNALKISSTAISDVMMFIQVEEKLETIERYRDFLEKVAAGKNNLPGDLVIAAQQLLDQTISPYKAQIIKFVSDAFDCTNGVCSITDKIKKKVTSEVKKKFPLLFQGKFAEFTGTFGDALAVIETSAVVVNAITKVGTVVKEASYVEAYAYLGQYFKFILDDKKNQFNANQNIDNAWEFYDMYNLLFRIRACGENAYLKMCQESAVTSILAKVGFKYFDISDRKQYVKDTFKYMNENCFFGLDNADQIPESHKFAQKAVIKCPVDVRVCDYSGNVVYTIFDEKEMDDVNTLGRFICKYDPKLGEYIKIVCLNDSDKYKIETVGVDSGNVNIETAVVNSDDIVTTGKITGLPIEKNGIITLDVKTGSYTDDQNGDGSNEYTGKLQETDTDEIIFVHSIKLSDETVALKVGEKKVVGVTINPTNATFTDVVWESSDESIAVVENGAIMGISAGEVKITVSTSDRKITAFCTVTVKPNGVLGDTNGDESVDIADSLMIARYDAGLIQLDENQLSVSDVNKDDSVDIADALMIARYDAGLIRSL